MKRIVALGGGESGVGAAVLAKVKGFDTFLSDNGSIPAEGKALLEKYGIPYEEGHHTPEKSSAPTRSSRVPASLTPPRW